MPLGLNTRNAWLNHLFGGSAYTQPTAWWVQLHFGNPGAAMTAYAWTAAGRRNMTTWSTAANKSNQCTGFIYWNSLPDPAPYSVVSHISIWNHETLSDAQYQIDYGQLDTPIVVALGGYIEFQSATIVRTIS